MNRKIWFFAALFAGAIAAAFLAGRAWHVAPEATVEKADGVTSETAAPIQDTVRLDDTAQRRTGLRIARAEMRTIEQTLQATGRVRPAETRIGPDDSLISVADLSTVWVDAAVYERDISSVRQGTTATITVDSYPGRTFLGRITYIGDSLDPNTRTAKVRCEVPNPDGVLKPDMFATVFVPVPEGKPAVVIPVEAVQQIAGQPVAFVPAGNGQFRQRGLKLGRRAGEWVEVTVGIRPGEQVVTGGSSVLKSEAKKAELGHHEE